MSKTKAAQRSAEPIARALPSLRAARDLADALCRTARQCHDQRSRGARVSTRAPHELEERAAERLCAICEDTLEQLTLAYERAAAALRPDGDDREWWRRANTLWLASREFTRRRRGCEMTTQRLVGRHTPQQLEALQVEFELEASALVALKRACDDYCHARPDTL